jgi:LuxR family transcriptional regulator, quorum-sensing system regulator SdiA
MAKETRKVEALREDLARIAAICDTGFALAVHIRFTRPRLLYQTYRADWNEYYSANGFMLTDPVVHWGLAHEGVVSWSELEANDAAGVLKEAKRFGLSNGWTYAVGPAASRTIAGLTKSGSDFTADERSSLTAIVDEIHALTDDFDTLPAAEKEAILAL